MIKQEEQLWNYIDGLCSVAEEQEIEAKLAADPAFEQLYFQLLEVNNQLETHLELDEPSMSFTRNVMEDVQHEMAPIALKTKVDNRIIYLIGGFFSLSLLGLLIFAFSTANFKMKMPDVNLTKNIDALVSPSAVMIFAVINAALLLIYLDSFMRKGMKKMPKK